MKISTLALALVTAFAHLQAQEEVSQTELAQLDQAIAEHQVSTVSWSFNLFHDEIYNEEVWTKLTNATKAFMNDNETLEWTDAAYKTSFNNLIGLLTETSDASLHGSCTVNLGAAQDKSSAIESKIETQKTFPSQAIVLNLIVDQAENVQSCMSVLKEFATAAQSGATTSDMQRLSGELAKSLFAHAGNKAHLSVNIIPAQ